MAKSKTITTVTSVLRKKRRGEPEAFLAKLKEGRSFAEVVREVCNNVKLGDVRVNLKSYRRTGTGEIPVKFGSKTGKKSTDETVQSIPGTKAA